MNHYGVPVGTDLKSFSSENTTIIHYSSAKRLHYSSFIKSLLHFAADSFYSVSALSVTSGASAAGGAADAFSAGLFGAPDIVSRTAQDGGEDGDDEKIHFTSFLSWPASRRP